MPKTSFPRYLFAILIIVSLLLTACGADETAPTAPADQAATTPLAPATAVAATSAPAEAATSTPEAAAPTASAASADQPTPTSAPAGANGVVADLGFRPETNGFAFQNYGPGFTNLTPAELQRIYGDQVCANKDNGQCTLTPPAQQFMEQANAAMLGGHCYGFSEASLLFFANQINPTDYGGTSITDLKLENNDPLQREIAYAFIGQIFDPVRAGTITGTPNDVLDKLIAALKQSPPTELYTIAIRKADGTGGHAVTPFEVQDRGNGTSAVEIYDNNYPNTTREIMFDRNANTWSYEASTNPSVASELYQGDASTQSLSLMPVSPATQQQPCPFCLQSTALKGGKPVADAGPEYNEIWIEGDADLLVTDSDGHNLGKVDGKLVNEIPGAYFDVYANADWVDNVQPTYYVPTTVDFQMTIDGTHLKAASTSDVFVIGPGYDLGVESVTLEPGQKDDLTVLPKDDVISYRTDSSESPDIVVGLEREGADYEFDIKGADITGGGRINVALDNKTGALAINADEIKQEGYFELIITRYDDNGEETFENDQIDLKADSVIYIYYADWKKNGDPVEIGVDTNNDGTIDETYSSADEK